MTDNTARRIMPTPQAEWMFELIVALKDQIDDLRIDRDMWRALALRVESGCGCEVDEHFPDFCPDCRIAELKESGEAWKQVANTHAENSIKYKAKLDAVNKLPEKWRKYTFDNPEATSYIDSADCADELEEALGEVK